ncbi:hypothetical protein [Microbacterium sediminis]|uniref:hypothetical protein n=1 Tax=Microbacterium sediminis TaxID=904291 RepID=UPI001071B685|nr:hypothetical protein [Microbacterium sediminis]QBR74984.1 hypothetical protein E3O41_11650 [Microbacterium sediminis]
MKRTIWLSAEIREEIEEILLILERTPLDADEILVDAPKSVLATMNLPAAVAGARVVAVPYSYATGISVPDKLRSLVSFSWRLVRRRPIMVFSGFSMMKHRLAAWLTRVPHAAYIRGVVFDPEVVVGISDKLRFGALRRLVPRRIVATYWADAVLTIGELNRQFLRGRGLSDQAIHVVGPVWLDGSSSAERAGDAGDRGNRGTAYFVTGAWEAHGRSEEHEAQLRITRRLAGEWRGTKRFALRVHPRDNYPYETDPAFARVELNRDLPGDFLTSLTADDVLITPLSTLAFEALHLGRTVVFYADPVATKAYFHMYERLGIDARSIDEILDGDLSSTRPAVEVFSRVDFDTASAALAGLVRR